MAVITPQTDIQLLQCPLEEDMRHTLTFSSLAAQEAYFNGLPKLSLSNATYMRKDGVLRMNTEFDTAVTYNYCRYRNKAFSNKWFYAFISNIQYVNDNVTTCELTTDVIQTWLFDFQYKPCFVEREHVANDSVGLHTLPEGLDLGEPVCTGIKDSAFYNRNDCYYVLQVSDLPQTVSPESVIRFGQSVNGMPNGTNYFIFDINWWDSLNGCIKSYAEYGKTDAILALFPVPKIMFSDNLVEQTGWWGGQVYYMPNSSESAASLGNVTVVRPSSLSGYTPRNNKLLTYPYNYFYFNNFDGATVEFKYEDFSSANCNFTAEACLTSGVSAKMWPTNYKNLTNKQGYGYGISLGNTPQGSWRSDVFTNWYAINGTAMQANATVGVGESLLSGAAAAFSGNLGGAGSAIVDMGKTVLNSMIEMERARKMPAQAKGDIACSPLNFVESNTDGSFYQMCIRNEYAQIIDRYFDMYGYKVNYVKVPNVTGRANWNYVKTIGAYVGGNIPEMDLTIYKEILDRGVTFWHNPATFMNYDAGNAII